MNIREPIRQWIVRWNPATVPANDHVRHVTQQQAAEKLRASYVSRDKGHLAGNTQTRSKRRIRFSASVFDVRVPPTTLIVVLGYRPISALRCRFPPGLGNGSMLLHRHVAHKPYNANRHCAICPDGGGCH